MHTCVLLVATRKGAWLFHSDPGRLQWRVDGPHFLGHTIHHLVADPRDAQTLLAAAKTGHLGPTVFRSEDRGHTWAEATQPPAFGPAAHGLPARSVDHTFWLTPGHASQPGVWFAGTSPQGLFRSADGGRTWAPWSDINDSPVYRAWMGTVQDGTPDGPKLHSITIDPRNPDHMLFAMSGGGVHRSVDGGLTFVPVVDGLEVVSGFDPTTVTFHDPHCVRLCPSQPDRLYQQNHCGVYRQDQPGGRWDRIGRHMPAGVGDIGFPVVVHPHNADVAWVFPMDGTDVWPRTAPAGRPAAYTTRDGGTSWERQATGFPTEQAWWTVRRQAMAVDQEPVVGVYVGTSSGALWASRDEGAHWTCLARDLPDIYAIETARFPVGV